MTAVPSLLNRSRRAARERLRATLDRPAGELLGALATDRGALVTLLVDLGAVLRDLDDLDPSDSLGARR